jgi:UDP-N-acetylglucosamine diphosphorylase/glucosamine-1-phosphate N-acetyltransferase
MNNIILFDDEKWKDLLPVCMTRPIAECRIGILKISEKWSGYLHGDVSYITKDYLAEKYPINISHDNLVINARWLPNDRLISLIKKLKQNDALLHEDVLVAARMDDKQFEKLIANEEIDELKGLDISKLDDGFSVLKRPHDIFMLNGAEIQNDFRLLKLSKTEDISPDVKITGSHPVYIDETAQLEPCFINANEGPVFIGKHVKVMQGAMLRGPLSLSEYCVVKMGAKIYKDCSFGPNCKVGGELSNVVMQSYSNKAHDGYLGNAVIGEWCNLGADTNNSNLKNNYAEVKLWNYTTKRFEKTGSQFCGLIMGDHSKTGINVMLNTGTVIGTCTNIFGSGFPRNYIPSYSWGGAHGYTVYRFEKAMETAEKVMKRRSVNLTVEDRKILEHIFHSTATFRNW